MGRRRLGMFGFLTAVAVVLVVAMVSRGQSKPKPLHPPAAAQKFGDNADLMRRLQRKRLVQGSH